MATKTAKKTSKATSASAWRQNRHTELELPSGNVALVRNPGIEMFIKTGIVPDSLTGLVREAIQEGTEDLDIGKLLEDDDSIERMMEMMDRVLVAAVVEPKVKLPPTYTQKDKKEERCGPDEVGQPVPLEDRDQSVLYADEVDFDDKSFIFQFAVGGTRDLERFREEQASMLDAVSPSEDVEEETE